MTRSLCGSVGAEAKLAARARFKDIRAQAHAHPRKGGALAGGRLARVVAPLWEGIGVAGLIVAGYAPFGTEIDVGPLLVLLEKGGASIALPRIVSDGSKDPPSMELVFWQTGSALSKGAFGIREPRGSSSAVLSKIAVFLMPALAVDAQGTRLGYGGGYYDRTVASARMAGADPFLLAVGYAEQFTERLLPRDSTDVPVHGFASPDGVKTLCPHEVWNR